jgi:hypothetical protein
MISEKASFFEELRVEDANDSLRDDLDLPPSPQSPAQEAAPTPPPDDAEQQVGAPLEPVGAADPPARQQVGDSRKSVPRWQTVEQPTRELPFRSSRAKPRDEHAGGLVPIGGRGMVASDIWAAPATLDPTS